MSNQALRTNVAIAATEAALSNRSVDFSLSRNEQTKIVCCREIIGLTDWLYESLVREGKLEERSASLVALLLGVKTTSEAVITLLEAGLINEALMLARPLLERATIFSFLTCCSDNEYEQYVSYSRQKAIRMLDRQVRAGRLEYALKYSRSEEIRARPEHARLVEMFTGPKGGEKTRWTSKSLADMIGEISEQSRAGKLSALVYLALFERASEALHGTLYGVMAHSGFWDPQPEGNPVDQAHAALHGVFNVIVTGVAAVLADMFWHANSILPLSDVVEQCEALRAAMSALKDRSGRAKEEESAKVESKGS